MPNAAKPIRSVTHPYYSDVTTESALGLAREIKHFPRISGDTPMPTVDEAIDILRQARARAGFNWITRQVSEEVLRLTLGENVVFG